MAAMLEETAVDDTRLNGPHLAVDLRKSQSTIA